IPNLHVIWGKFHYTMFDSILAFFRRLFGSDQEKTNAEIVRETANADDLSVPEEFPEDGSDVYSDVIGERAIIAPTTRSMAPIGEVADPIEVDESTVTGAGPVMITAPRYLWCLDNGHGSLQAGKRSPKFEDGSRFEEWEFNRAIVRGIIEKLEPMGVQLYNVVPEDEIGKFLGGRVKRANNRVSDLGLQKIFVSVHANAAPLNAPDTFREDVKGIETFHFPRSKTGNALATVFHKHIVGALGWRDRGVKSANFYVLANTSMPAVLTECGFYTSKQQATDLLDPAIRQKIIDAHCDAILELEKVGMLV
ncbi:MAG: N-acetylmuramoyl-L-alanine amidase, partial [Bacteroidia bacterium]